MGQAAALTYALTDCGFSKRGRKGMDQRIFLSALIYIGKTGCWWCHLPQEFGKFKTIHSRYTNWAKRGVFDTLFELVRDSDDSSVLRFLDSSFVKCSICSLTGICSESERVIGKTKGGHTTKVVAVCDTKQRVHACRIDPGNDSECKVAERIELTGRDKIIVGDKGFSSKKLRDLFEKAGHRHCIAQKCNEKTPAAFNKSYYRKRHHIENIFAKMGRWTRLELRRERLSYNFNSFVKLWAIGTWVEF